MRWGGTQRGRGAQRSQSLDWVFRRLDWVLEGWSRATDQSAGQCGCRCEDTDQRTGQWHGRSLGRGEHGIGRGGCSIRRTGRSVRRGGCSIRRTGRSVRRTGHCARCTVRFIRRTVHSFRRVEHSFRRTVRSARRTVHSFRRTVRSARRTVQSIRPPGPTMNRGGRSVHRNLSSVRRVADAPDLVARSASFDARTRHDRRNRHNLRRPIILDHEQGPRATDQSAGQCLYKPRSTDQKTGQWHGPFLLNTQSKLCDLCAPLPLCVPPQHTDGRTGREVFFSNPRRHTQVDPGKRRRTTRNMKPGTVGPTRRAAYKEHRYGYSP